MTTAQERIAIAIGNFAHAMGRQVDVVDDLKLRLETREALHALFTELVAERDACCDDYQKEASRAVAAERIAEQARREGQEIAAGLHERIAELERELAAAKGKLDEAAKCVASWHSTPRLGAEYINDNQGDCVHYGDSQATHFCAGQLAKVLGIAAAQGGAVSNRRERQFLVITRDVSGGPINVIRCEIPSTPQTIAIRVRPGQQVVIELEEDNTKAKRTKPVKQPQDGSP